MTTYERTNEFAGATFKRADFSGATFRFCDLSGVSMNGVDVAGLAIDSHDLFFGSLYVNGVDVVPYVKAELNRQFPGRELQEATTPEGLREGWNAVQQAWHATVTETPATLREQHVPDEWSLSQTLRHLILATDAWLLAGIHRQADPFHRIGLFFTGAEHMGIVPEDMREPHDFDEVLAVRAERQQMVTDFLATATQAQLDEPRQDPWNPEGDWKPTVGDCLRVILEEEWAHLRYIRRDLARLQP
ncbi:MAG: DinB family protein [Propionibacteriaceae bacterium]|nr:DinB family protein [Propionibacteriaceae bacterium]